MEVKSLVLERGRFKVQDGTQTRFWEGTSNDEISVSSYYSEEEECIGGSCTKYYSTECLLETSFVGENWNNWLGLVGCILTVNLTECNDSFIWTASKRFSVKNMYNDLMLKIGSRLIV
jgi:hypothetical protein